MIFLRGEIFTRYILYLYTLNNKRLKRPFSFSEGMKFHFFGKYLRFYNKVYSQLYSYSPSCYQFSFSHFRLTAPGRDSNGISKLPRMHLILPYKISCIKGSSEIPLISLQYFAKQIEASQTLRGLTNKNPGNM